MKQIAFTRLALLALVLAGAAGFSPSAHAGYITNVVSFLTFESAIYDPLTQQLLTPDGRPRASWTCNHQSGYDPNPDASPVADTWFMYPDTDPTNTCAKVTMDLTPWSSPHTSDATFDQGFGAAMPAFDTRFIRLPANRANYRLSFDAKAEGMLSGVDTINFQMQVQMEAPDNTIQPPDPDSDGDRIIQINKDLSVGTNWTHFEYWLDNAGIDAGTPAENFDRYYYAITNINVNVNLSAPNDGLGFDAQNDFYLDNVKLEARILIPPEHPPTFRYTAVEWNFDDKPLQYSFGAYNFSQNAFLPTLTQNPAVAGYGVGGSNAWILTLDNRALAAPNTPQAAGGGAGGGSPADFARFFSSSLYQYWVSFDTRVEGLAPGKLSTAAQLLLFLYAPDDTIYPPDTDTAWDTVLSLTFDFTATTNWQTLIFPFNTGLQFGSADNFYLYYNRINAMRMQWQILNAASDADWGFDADNVLVMDNFKIQGLVRGLPPLSVTADNNNLVLTWDSWNGTGTVQVQTTRDPNSSTWTPVPGATTSPATVPKTAGPQFFRLVWVPPQ